MREARYHDLVAAWLRTSFADVDHEPRIALPDDAPGSYVIPDFVASTPFEQYAIEVEDSAVSLETGLGQALRYATLLGAVPVVVLPAEAWPGRGRFGAVEIVTV